MIFESPQLRKAVFSHLGISSASFPGLTQYAFWLGIKDRGTTTTLNILEVASAYAYMRLNDLLPNNPTIIV